MATISTLLLPEHGSTKRGRAPYMVQKTIDLTAQAISCTGGDVVQCLTIPANTRVLHAGVCVVESATMNTGTNATAVGLASPNPLVKAGMRVTGGTLPAAGVLIASVTNISNYVLATAQSIAADSTLTYSYDSESKIKVHTINNEVIEFANPIQGSILPVSVVQVYSTDTGGGISNLVALS